MMEVKVEKEMKIYTIGHSNHKIDDFMKLLKKHAVNCIVDVRSDPFSKHHPQFNKDNLERALKEEKIEYLHFGKEFGARRTEKELLGYNGKVDFEKVRNTEEFKKGVERLKKGIEKGFVIALLCAEKDPAECHRFALVSVGLVEAGFTVEHILADGTVRKHEEVEKELINKRKNDIANYCIPFSEKEKKTNKQSAKEIMYAKKEEEIAYSVVREKP